MENEKQKFTDQLRRSISDNTFVRISFGKYRGDDREFENIFVTRLELKDGEKLSFKFRYKTKDIVKNFDTEAGIKLSEEILGKDFLSATLFTTANDFSLEFSKKRIPKLHIKKPTYTSPETPVHNRVKPRFANPQSGYFHSLGITDKEGNIKADGYNKFRQVDKFLEITDSLYRSSDLNSSDEICITDMGSGKSYITFALYDYFRNTLKKKVKVLGIEQKEELVKLSDRIAKENGFNGLSFKSNMIRDTSAERADILVALHACDTATDDAIINGINSDASIIILAPCCQKYLRKKLILPEVTREIFRHGILEERLAVSLTDGLRAMMLEYYGYTTKIFEFISSEHTAKNTMITAVKRNSTVNKSEDILNKIKQIKDEFGLDDFYLDKLLLNNNSLTGKAGL